MRDPSMLTIQASAQSGQPAQPAQTLQSAQDAARLELEALQLQQKAQTEALEALEALQGKEGPATEVIRIGPGGEIIRVDPGEEAVTVTTTQPPDIEGMPFVFEPQIPQGAVVMAVAFFIMIAFIIVGLPIARALARRMDRAPAPGARPSAEQAEQLRHIQTAVDAMAVEIERISENQRYVTRLLAEGAPVGVPRLDQGARHAEPLEVPGERR